MSDAKEVTFSMKVMINKHKTKVLFAEVDSDFADVLLSFLTLPLGTILKLLEKHYGDEAPFLGSLTTLYDGLANLDSVHFWAEGDKQMLLNPRNSFEAECCKLKLDINHMTKYFSCEEWLCGADRWSNISMCYGTRCQCGKSLKWQVVVMNPRAEDEDGGVFTISNASFLISDDLQMVPNMVGTIMETLSNFGITDIDEAELRNVAFGFNEVMNLLKASLYSRTPLTDIILSKTPTAKSEAGILFHEMKKEASSDSEKIILKVMLHKSTNKLLFAQSKNDFIDFLFSLLTIPLGGVECLLEGNTCFKNIDNLYQSIQNINGDRYLKTGDTKGRLINPKLYDCYVSEKQILPLHGQIPSKLYHYQDVGDEFLSYNYSDGDFVVHALNTAGYPNGKGNYVKGPTMYMVTDDLTVTPLCMTSSLSILKELKITLSDVKEVEVQIGLQEALSILKASLTSTSALTEGLKIYPLLKKQPKQEH